ncbi:MAG: CPBP family intramembrane metalloprotease [Flavobacteriales bacterium]|nr:CPBP family intramembrane metalloprotease [Flavobacteriales bacterium]
MLTNQKPYKAIELLLLFVALPISLILPFLPVFKLITVLIGVGYCIWIARKHQLITKKSLYQIKIRDYWKTILISLILVFVSSFIFIYLLHPEDLFIVVKKKPLMWIMVLFFYAIFSVYPQELMYRSFFFKRYEGLFKNTNYLLIANIIVFPLAHLMFKNWLVLLVTLIGGILFAFTYKKSKSVMLTSIEHAIYGNWLFTIGMGEMLAFPMPN